MILIYTIVVIWHLVASLPLLFGLVSGYKYRSCGTPSGRLIGMLFGTSAVSLVILFTCPALFSAKSSNVLLLLGSVVTSAMGLAFGIRRFCAVSLVLLIASIVMVEFAILAVVDHRFRIVVQDQDGMPVDIKESEMALYHAPTLFGATGIYSREGIKLEKGKIYFGLSVWLQNKDKWMFCGDFHDSEGHELGDLDWKHAKWSEWPKLVIVE